MENAIINHFAVFVAALSDFVVGALWYSPLLFYKRWMAANNFTENDLKRGNPAVTYSLTFVLAYVISYNLAFFLGSPDMNGGTGMLYGLLTGVWAAAAFTIVSLFEKRSAVYVMINTSYMLAAFTLKGWIIGVWR
jgi:hypothetical protein